MEVSRSGAKRGSSNKGCSSDDAASIISDKGCSSSGAVV